MSGVVLNILALGATSFLLAMVLGPNVNQAVASLPRIQIHSLAQFPFVGRALFTQNVMVDVAYLGLPVAWWVLRRTSAGLALEAAESSASTFGVCAGPRSPPAASWPVSVGDCWPLPGWGSSPRT